MGKGYVLWCDRCGKHNWHYYKLLKRSLTQSEARGEEFKCSKCYHTKYSKKYPRTRSDKLKHD